MKFSTAALPFAAVLIASVASIPITKRDVPANLVPDFGHAANVNPTGTGDCDGAVNGADGKPIKIPCACPPPRDQFIASLSANAAVGHAVNNPSVPLSFPTDDSQGAKIARMQASLVTLQNLNGPGKGCPAVSTTFSAQLSALQSGGAAAPPPPAAAPPPPAPAPPPPAAAGAADSATVARLAPQLNFNAGVNPTGTGDCDGAVNGPNGQPIKIPCACPPPQAQFVTALQANVALGFAVNNPTVPAPFPTDDSPASQKVRINTGLITLQNLNGPGKGCPAVSSTLQAQSAALGP